MNEWLIFLEIHFLLFSDDVFIVDTGSKLSVWVGRGASQGERREGMARATAYLARNGYPANTPIERVSEGAESAQFKAEFFQWDPPRPISFAPRPTTGVAQAKAETQVYIHTFISFYLTFIYLFIDFFIYLYF